MLISLDCFSFFFFPQTQSEKKKKMKHSRSSLIRNWYLCTAETIHSPLNSHSFLMQVFNYSLLYYVKVTTASVVEYCKCCLIGSEVGYGSEIFKRRLIINSPLCVVFLWGGGTVMLSLENLRKRPRFHFLPCTN